MIIDSYCGSFPKIPCVKRTSKILSGWWFQTFFSCHNIWDTPSHWLSYFSEGLKPPTSYGVSTIQGGAGLLLLGALGLPQCFSRWSQEHVAVGGTFDRLHQGHKARFLETWDVRKGPMNSYQCSTILMVYSWWWQIVILIIPIDIWYITHWFIYIYIWFSPGHVIIEQTYWWFRYETSICLLDMVIFLSGVNRRCLG